MNEVPSEQFNQEFGMCDLCISNSYNELIEETQDKPELTYKQKGNLAQRKELKKAMRDKLNTEQTDYDVKKRTLENEIEQLKSDNSDEKYEGIYDKYQELEYHIDDLGNITRYTLAILVLFLSIIVHFWS
jgi:hypothetical protein